MTRLELERRLRNLSQEQLGNELLYSRQLVSRLENEHWSPADVHPRLRRALESFFSLTLEDLLAHVEPPGTCTAPCEKCAGKTCAHSIALADS